MLRIINTTALRLVRDRGELVAKWQHGDRRELVFGGFAEVTASASCQFMWVA